MVVGFVGVSRDLVFPKNLNKHFGCLGEQIYKNYICLPLIASGEKVLSVAMTWKNLVKAGHNLGSEIFFSYRRILPGL